MRSGQQDRSFFARRLPAKTEENPGRHRIGTQTSKAFRRSRPIESQCARHRRNLPATPPEEHHLRAALAGLCHRQVYSVDNVATSGNTMRAAFAALQRGAGLVFADAGHNTTTHTEPTLFDD